MRAPKKHGMIKRYILQNWQLILQTMTITRPDDWHIHLREGEYLEHTVSAVSAHFGRALIMPNLKTALCTTDALVSYRQKILAAIPAGRIFNPLMTFYLKESMSGDEFSHCKDYPFIIGGKLYPAGATTNSSEGVNSIHSLYPLFECMQQLNLVLQIHAEVTHGDIFEREATFIREHMPSLLNNFPKLRIVLEHISTKAAVDFVSDGPSTLAATITPQHILYNRNQLLAGGLRPHFYCLPVLKHEVDQKAIQGVLAKGHRKFFAGTDSAPHSKTNKENECACAGVYSSPYAVALYARAFDQISATQHINAFLSRHGADFYELPYNTEELVLIKKEQIIPKQLPFGKENVVPMAAGESLAWSVV